MDVHGAKQPVSMANFYTTEGFCSSKGKIIHSMVILIFFFFLTLLFTLVVPIDLLNRLLVVNSANHIFQILFCALNLI